MTSSHLRPISISLNDERGTGGQTRLARVVGWHHNIVWRKLTGRSPIIQSDHRAIRQALEKLFYNRPPTTTTAQK